ncbi:uncharacterized protein [Haliotis asinina]|uniref:uncharacterized protein n=1 Tax=Haliotis asinina TaxID=109174 RepID=UPI0035322180
MTVLLTVSLLLLLASPGLTMPPEVDRAKKMSDPNQWKHLRPQNHQASGCVVSGQNFNHGGIFIMNSNPCIKYQCQNGQALPIEIKCLDEHNRCHVVGSTVRRSDCLMMQCQANGVLQHVQSDPYKCKDINNVCRRPYQDVFPMNVNGYHVNGCTCRIEGGQVKYYCPQVGKKKK